MTDDYSVEGIIAINIRTTVARAAGIGAVGTATLLSGAAGADTFIPLAGGDLNSTMTDGTGVHVRLDGESVNINSSMGSSPLHRNAWVSGTAHVELSAEVRSGIIDPGYVVGCQVDISGGAVGGGPNAGLAVNGQNVQASVGADAGGNLTLGPGQAKSFHLLDLEQRDPFGDDFHMPMNGFKGTSGSVSWADESIGVSGCAGYAQARAFVNVEIRTDSIASWVTVWGQPFSIG